MRRDPTEFRNRVLRWKNGELVYENGRVIPSYEDGKDPQYQQYLNTLPENQAHPSAYRQYRYWELNGKPKTFSEAVSKGMFTYLPDGWHAGSVAYNNDTNEYELMKPNNHPTRWMENVAYFLNKDFYDNWELKKSLLREYGYDKYVPRKKLLGLPKYEDGKDAVVEDIIKTEGFLTTPKDIGDGKITVGSGLTAKKWIDKYNKLGKWTKEDNLAAVTEEVNAVRNWLPDTIPAYNTLPKEALDVLVDIGYNIGPGGLSKKKSPKFHAAIERGDWEEAARQMDWGNNLLTSDGKPMRGLRKRNAIRQERWLNAFANKQTNQSLNKIQTMPNVQTNGQKWVTTGGAYIPSPRIYKEPSKEFKEVAKPIETAAGFMPYLGTTMDLEDVSNGNINKIPSAGLGIISDLMLPGVLRAIRYLKASRNLMRAASNPIDRYKYYQQTNNAIRSLSGNAAILGVGLYQDILDTTGSDDSEVYSWGIPHYKDGKDAIYWTKQLNQPNISR